MASLRILGVVSLPILLVLIGLFVGLAITGTGDRADKDNRGLPSFATATPIG